ncbi:hypothetical protein TRVA0_042S00958 [Trichomonascus vanleenenianus]|uniref:F-box protein n=1 Tax=Trichomonascus vanleenenianus TaxID=2268995 RepID=UPI003ECA7334
MKVIRKIPCPKTIAGLPVISYISYCASVASIYQYKYTVFVNSIHSQSCHSLGNPDKGKTIKRMENIDFITRLPIEISNQILGYLSLAAWRKLRLVSRQWNDRPSTWALSATRIRPSRLVTLRAIELVYSFSAIELDQGLNWFTH